MEQRAHRSPLDTFEQALRNATPLLEVKPRRVGGSTYQVPVEIRGDRRTALAMRWLIQSARRRPGKTMSERLANELLDAYQGVGATIKKREDTHRMAEANRAFAHYRF
jgi:small subunit ribosomal protein S7